MKTWVKVLTVIIVAAVVMAGVGIYTGVLDVQKLLELGNGGDDDDADELLVHFINVGQGDSILIQFPDGENVLIDAGGNLGSYGLISYLEDRSVQTIDWFFITHPHADHINYADEVLEVFDVDHIVMTDYQMDTAAYDDLIYAVNAEGCTRVQPSIGMEIDYGGGGVMTVLFFDDDAENPNDSCIVLRLDYGETSFLFTGDIGFAVEDELIRERPGLLDVDVLKVAHHGSAYSTSTEFLSYVIPDISVISVGPNDYGHPSNDTLDRLYAWGSAVYTTWDDGDVVVTTDGSVIEV